MTIPTTCPHCSAPYAKDGKFSCSSEWISGKAFQSQFCKLNAAAKEVVEFRTKKCFVVGKDLIRKLKGATL